MPVDTVVMCRHDASQRTDPSHVAHEFTVNRQVEFADTDMAGIMHFSRFFTFMEAAEHAFYRSLGLSVDMEKTDKSLGVGWPRVKAECEYKKPLRFEETVTIRMIVREIRNRSVSYEFVFTKVDGAQDVEVARGRLTVVCVAKDKQTNQMKAVAIPSEIRRMIEVAPPGLLPDKD
jgi:YbgC/YbaW family acyl-CoA thioester hydrolase